jgi:hypothetical protein
MSLWIADTAMRPFVNIDRAVNFSRIVYNVEHTRDHTGSSAFLSSSDIFLELDHFDANVGKVMMIPQRRGG